MEATVRVAQYFGAKLTGDRHVWRRLSRNSNDHVGSRHGDPRFPVTLSKTRRLFYRYHQYVPSDVYKTRLTVVLNNEGAGGGWNGLWHYYHFTAEDTLGAIVGYAAVEPAIPEPERLLVPYGMNWRDKWGLNEMIVEGMFPKRTSAFYQKLTNSGGRAGPVE